MSRHKSPEEVRQNHIETLGGELGGLYHALWNELAWLYSKWGEYVLLFGKKPSRLELLNEAASHFFRIVQDSLWEDILLHIARLTDPPKSAGKQNLTIKTLLLHVEDEALKENLSKLINTAVEKSDFCRDWRNRRIAHKDLGLALNSGAKALMPASRAKIKEALSAISDTLNAISNHYLDSTTCFEGVGSSGGALSLLYVIDDGLRAEKELKEKVKTGTYSYKEHRVRNL